MCMKLGQNWTKKRKVKIVSDDTMILHFSLFSTFSYEKVEKSDRKVYFIVPDAMPAFLSSDQGKGREEEECLDAVTVIGHYFHTYFWSIFDPTSSLSFTNTLFFLMFISLCFSRSRTDNKDTI